LRKDQERCAEQQGREKINVLYSQAASLDNDSLTVSPREAEIVHNYIEEQAKTLKKDEEFSSAFLLTLERSLVQKINEIVFTEAAVKSNFSMESDQNVTKRILSNERIDAKVSFLKNRYNVDVNFYVLYSKETKGSAWDFFSSFDIKKVFFIDLNGVIYPSEITKRGQKVDIYLMQNSKAQEQIEDVLDYVLEDLK
jgi:hypothetical protein